MRFLWIIFLSGSLFAQTNKRLRVLAVYPTTDAVPVNILRFYIQFSAPMQEMNILKHVQLLDEEGKNISDVFFENQYELWNEDRTEVTLIVDPGRVKLGLLAHNTLGRAFDEGRKYRLIVDSLLLDFNGNKLSRSYTKQFTAAAEDVQPPDVALWSCSKPVLNTKDTLTVYFNDKIDHISAQTLIKVYQNNKEIKGFVKLAKQEQQWLFIPAEKWRKGKYQIIVNPRLEDIAANSVNQIFDHRPSDFKLNNDENFIIPFIIE